MFSFKEKENEAFNSSNIVKSNNFARNFTKSERSKKLQNTRLSHYSEQLNWHSNLNEFSKQLQSCSNYYSLLVTMFEISQDPQWRNRSQFICLIIQKLHNDCIETNGNCLPEIKNIRDYEFKINRMFWLMDGAIQEHLRLLVIVYLAYNNKYQIFDEGNMALSLINAGKAFNGGESIEEYLWIVAQIRNNAQSINRMVKLAVSLNQSQLEHVLLPTLTILANFIYFQSLSIVEMLLNNQQFQSILVHGLSHSNVDLSRESLLVVNNLIAKDPKIAVNVLNCKQITNLIEKIEGGQKDIFLKLAQLRSK